MTAYLEKQTLYPPLIKQPPDPNLGIVVVIPAFEEKALSDSLQSLVACLAPDCAVEVIILINEAANAASNTSAINQKAFDETHNWLHTTTSPFCFHLLYIKDLPPKHAGVGLARKIGMDEACRRLESVAHPEGIIACFDADSHCDDNYLLELERHFKVYPKSPACSIYFEHPLDGDAFSKEVYEAITWYELHLRYFVQAQRYIGFPFAYHTVGSSMAVRCRDYQLQGGMNKRKAGEDFYFLHKFTPSAHFSNLTSTRVIPSPRVSHRVPFGTGRAIGDWLAGTPRLDTYAPDSFEDLKVFFEAIPLLYSNKRSDITHSFPVSIQVYLKSINAHEVVESILWHTSDYPAFRKRFFRWFDAFQVMKFIHFARDHHYPNAATDEAAYWLLRQLGQIGDEKHSIKHLLEAYRKLERSM